jgi:hypothetical protein
MYFMKYIGLFKSFVLCGLLMAAGNANAQMLGTDVFLQGKYLEVGIGNLGYFGSDTTAPSGYHQHPDGSHGVGVGKLGFVSDYGMDGWWVGIPPLMGDYFLPGIPYEGWELQVDTMRCQAFNNGPGTKFKYAGGMPACSGSNISYTTSGSKVIGTWQGMVDSITVTQITSIDTNTLYFTVKVILTNTSYTPKNNIYYFRTIDPDNDETWPGGSFKTINTIKYQMPDSTVVSATGITGAYTFMALGTVDTPATAIIYNNWPLDSSVDLGTLFNQTYGPADYTQGTNDNGDIAIGLVFKIAHLATVDSAGDSVARKTDLAYLHPANRATFSYFYAFGVAATDSAISVGIRTKPPPDTIATIINTSLSVKNVNSNEAIKVYPNPAKNIINVTGLNTGDQLTVYDAIGRKVAGAQATNGTGVSTVSMGNTAAGAYLLVVNDVNGNVKARVPARKL